MCVILDTNSVSEVFGQGKSVAGGTLHNWIMKGGIKLVVGKTILEELNNNFFKDWYSTALNKGRVIHISKQEEYESNEIIKDLLKQSKCKSNDQHIIALAQVSGARLLYTQDNDLMSDFKKLLRGTIYPRGDTSQLRKDRQAIQKNKKWCTSKH